MMLRNHRLLVRAFALLVGLNLLTAGTAAADPSDCSDSATGAQSGRTYEKVGQYTRTTTQTVTLDAGFCGVGAEGTVTTTDTYNVGVYQDSLGNTVHVNCSTGQVIG